MKRYHVNNQAERDKRAQSRRHSESFIKVHYIKFHTECLNYLNAVVIPRLRAMYLVYG